jgi:HEPN domain-containing protein
MKKETEEWLKIAFEDYDAAKCLFERELYRMVCYHCQQAVENIKTDAIILPRPVFFEELDLLLGGFENTVVNEKIKYCETQLRRQYDNI